MWQIGSLPRRSNSEVFRSASITRMGKRSIMPMLFCSIIIATVIFLGLRSLRGARLYVSNPSGYTAFGGGSEILTLVPKDRYERVLKAMIAGVPFDCLQISRNNDLYRGIVLSRRNGKIELMITILRLKEPKKLATFRDGMKSHGYTPTADYATNVGLGFDMEQQLLEYECDPDFAKVAAMASHSLDLAEGKEDQIYVYPWSSSDGAPSSGIRIVTPTDYLSKLP